DAYRGYETLSVLVGRLAKPLPPDALGSTPAELFQAPGVLAVFTPKSQADDILVALGRSAFTQLDIPAGEGDPKDLLEGAVSDREKWRARLEEIQGRLDKLRERYAGFVVAAEELLEIEVDKAEAPLRFAVSDHSFVIDGWVPSARLSDLRERTEALGLFVELEEHPSAHAEQ